MSEKIRVGIIGCGGIGIGKHLPSLANLPDVEVVAFCDLEKQKAEDAKKQFGTPNAKVYTNYKQLLKDESIQTVHVCTPNRSHSFITIDALHAGKHVICEKPMAKTAKEARAMVEAAKETGKLLTIGYQNRYKPSSLYLKKACDNGDLGEIYFAKALAVRRRGVPTWGVFIKEFEQGGGPLIDIGTHALDLTLWQMNNYKPKMVVGSTFYKFKNQTETANDFGDWNPDEFTVEDSAFGFIVMENGATIILESSWALNTLEQREAQSILCGTKAGADMLDGLRINTVKYGCTVTENPSFYSGGVAFFDGAGGDDPSVSEARVFYNAVTKGTPLCVLPEQACVVTEILEAIYKSAKTGKPVYFNNKEN